MNIQSNVEGSEKGMSGHHEVEREGRRVLRSLSYMGIFLGNWRRRRAAANSCWQGSKRAGRTRRTMRVSAVIVAEILKCDGRSPRGTRPETFSLSEVGTEWLSASGAGAPFVNQHQLLTQRWMKTPDGAQIVTINELESPLSRLHLRGQVTPAQLEAGEKLRQDFTLAGMMPRLCADLTAPISGGGAKSAPMTEKIIAARQRYRLAMASVGPGLCDLLLDVCCHLKGLEAIEANNEWPARSAKVVLQIALDRLAAHYGLAARGSRRRVRVWRAEDVSAST